MTTPKTSKPAPEPPKGKKKPNPEADRAVVKPKGPKEQDVPEGTWTGGVDRFGERI